VSITTVSKVLNNHDDISPATRARVLAKVADWLTAGTKLVWLIDPRRSAVHVYRADGTLAVLGEGGSLEGESVLPGFTCPVMHVFA
jgi:Uma2 family endonuclease